MESIIFNGKEFKQYRYNPNYFVSCDGEVFSNFSKKIIKNGVRGKEKQYYSVDITIDHSQKHIPVHKIVYDTWVRKLEPNEQVNHRDDNSFNNNVSNLYVGTQKENIQDCINNNHRVGNVFYLTVFDKEIGKVLTFAPAGKFIEYSGHSNKSGSLNKFFSKQWFKQRYEIIEYKRVKNLDELKGVTTMADECRPVE